MNILFIGDIFGKPGRNLIREYLPDLKKEFKVDFCVANGENTAGGKGINRKAANQLLRAGVDGFTSGNHLWDLRESYDFLKEEKRIVKPINFAKNAIGNDYYVHELQDGTKIFILSIIGHVFMSPADSPIAAVDNLLPKLQEISNNIIIDFHAEATAEKRAIAYYFDGKISAFIGTHTHIQTADEEILPNGTAYITDAGMTGPHDSVIGMKKEIILNKMLTSMPQRFNVAEDGLQINAVLIKIDEKSGKAKDIFRIRRKYD